MNQAAVIFPHQLFRSHPGLSRSRPVYMIEDPVFFFDQRRNVKFHKKKLVLHRASMQYFQDNLESQGFEVRYIDYQKDPEVLRRHHSVANKFLESL